MNPTVAAKLKSTAGLSPNILRSIDRCLDLSDLRDYLADFYSPIGRQSIDPELMIRLKGRYRSSVSENFTATSRSQI